MNRREFVIVSAVLPIVSSLRHKHSYTHELYWDAVKCDCGNIVTGIDMANISEDEYREFQESLV